MKLSAPYTTLLVSAFSNLGYSMVGLDHLPSTVHVGETHEIRWSTDQDYTLEFLLVHSDGDSGWSPVHTIFENRFMAAGNSSYNWTVPSVNDPSSSYGLWLSGDNFPPNGGGYANLTNWFKIEDGSSVHAPHKPSGLSAGEITAIPMGIFVALSLGAAAAVTFLRARRTRSVRLTRCNEGYERESFDSIVDEKTKAGLAMKEVGF